MREDIVQHADGKIGSGTITPTKKELDSFDRVTVIL